MSYHRPAMTCEHCGARFLPGSHFVCKGEPVFSVEGLTYVAAERDRNATESE